jgi:hypothetical protein
MNPALEQAIERLDALCPGPDDLPALALWELRGTLRGEGLPLAADGGWRLELGTRRGLAWRFAVGAGPAAALPSGRRTPSRPALDPTGWRAALKALEADLSEEMLRLRSETAPLAAGLARSSAAACRTRLECHVRWRAWRCGRAAPRAAIERGVRVVIEPGDGARPGEPGAIEWVGPAGGSPPWRGDPAGWLSARRMDRRVEPEPAARGGAAVCAPGPLVLLPAAAAWWTHEMGHAALETARRIGPVRTAHGLSIVDDPASGPWPAGFAVDDAGRPARAAVLWDADGPRVPAASGRRRRPSVRDAAERALAVTRLTGGTRNGARWGELPDGTPVAASVRAGRFDPPTGTIVLELAGVGRVAQGRPLAGSGRAVVAVDAAAGWQGVRRLADGPLADPILAACSRIGATVPVMVGAPTIVLDPVQVVR